MEYELGNTTMQLKAAQERYKRRFDRNLRATNQGIKEGDFLLVDPEDGGGKKKLGEHSIGPFHVLGRD